MIGSFLTRGLVMIFGYVYPAYECFKTVEKNKPEIEHLRFWCQYWILVAVLTVCERIGDAFVSWVPMYSEAKLAFYIYLWYPKTKGTTYVYDSFFRPYVAKHEPEIDRNLLELRTRAGDTVVLYWQRAASYGQTRVFEILQYVAAQSTTRPQPVQPRQQGARIRPPTAATQPQPQVPLSPTSSASSSQHQQNLAEKDKHLETPAPPPSAALSSQKIDVNSSVTETSTQPASSEAESSMQIDSSSSTGNEIANPVPKETILDQAPRVTRGRLRKYLSAPNP